MKLSFEDYLKKENLSQHTISVYLWTVDYFISNYKDFSTENLHAYKGYLMEFFKPKTVNLRIQAINKYLDYIGKDKLRLSAVKIQQKTFLENVVSNADYTFLSMKGQVISEGTVIFSYPKYFCYEEPHLQATVDGDYITVSADAYAKSVEILNQNEDLILSDNYFDLNADSKTVKVISGSVDKLRLRSVYDIN